MEAQIANAINNADRVRKVTEIPLFYARADKDTIVPHVLLDRVETAAQIAGWDNPRKCLEFFNILRDKAHEWHEGLKLLKVPLNNWDRVKQEFLQAYEPRYTAHTACTNIRELTMKPGETVQEYFNRVSVVFTRLLSARPANFELAQTVFQPQPMTPAENMRVAKAEGIDAADQFFLTQLFIAGMNEDLRREVMKDGHLMLQDVLNSARMNEVILKEKRFKVSAIGSENPEIAEIELSSEEIEAVNQIRQRNGKGSLPSAQNGHRKPKFGGQCRYCHRPGHKQTDCRQRKAAGAPCVDDKGRPWKVNAVENDPELYEKETPEDLALAINTLNW